MQLVLRLHQQLAAAKGKKVYKYLKPDVKRTVDAIFEKLAEDPHIQQMYSLWCDLEQTKHDMYSSAKINFPTLADNPTFQSVKNMIIKSVKGMQLIPSGESVLDIQQDVDDMLSPIDFTLPDGDDFTTEFEADGMFCYMKWTKAYKRACELLHKNDMMEEEKQECLRLLTAEAEKGNVLALYDLGRVYASGFLDETDADKSEEYYQKTLTGFLELEAVASKQQAYLQYCIGKMYVYGLGTAQNKTKAFEWFQKSAEAGNGWAELWLGRMLLFGADGIEADWGKAVSWLTRSTEHGNTYASSLLDNMKQFENQVVADSIFGLFVNLSRMIEEDYDRSNRKLHSQVDSKLRQVIRRKKMELGVKEDNFPMQNYQ